MATVLLVEDDPSARAALDLALSRQGHSVTAHPTGEAGLEHIRAARPELAVLDVMLPGIDGVEVCRRIRRIDDLPVILLTARSDDIDVVMGLEAGAAGSAWRSRGPMPNCTAARSPRPAAIAVHCSCCAAHRPDRRGGSGMRRVLAACAALVLAAAGRGRRYSCRCTVRTPWPAGGPG